MWLFTKHGFYSVVQKEGVMHVRARKREHLETLRREYGVKPKVREWKQADYKFRVLLEPAEWERLAACLLRDIDYDNFKTACRSLPPAVLHTVWNLMWRALGT
jgi:hypothetical protein